MKMFLRLITVIAVMLSGLAFSATAANAGTTQEPVVDLSNIQYGSASFETDGSAAAKASLRSASGVKIYLNVQAHPMTKKQIKPGSCRRAPVGKKFYNEMIDPETNKHYYKPWRVQAGDNVFCKDRKGVWRKKSCNNIAKGLFGVPKPPASKIRVSADVRNYLAWSGELELKSQQSGTATAHVVQYYEDKVVCEAKASVNGRGLAYVRISVKVKSRTVLGIQTSAVNQAKLKASTDTTVTGTLKGKVDVDLEGNATAMCNYQPPTTPPPPAEQPPTFMQFREFNDLEVNWTSDHCVTVDFPSGHSGKVFWTATYGSFATSTKAAQDGVQVCSTYKAPSEVPSGGKDTITVTATDDVTGLSVNKSTQPFVIHETAQPPL